MIITKHEIEKMFQDLIEENESREHISFNANKLLQAIESEQLDFESFFDKEAIWVGIKYLSKVDVRGINGEYLRSISNLIDFAKQTY